MDRRNRVNQRNRRDRRDRRRRMNRRKRGKSRNSEEKRRKILSAAIKVLNTKEYHKCPVDEIARCAKVAKGTIYLYFKSKEDLYFAVFFYMIDQIKKIAAEVFKNKIPASKQIELFLNQVDIFIGDYKNIIGTMRPELKSIDRDIHKKMHKQFYELLKSVSQIIQKGIDEKEFKNYPPELVASMLLSLLTIISHGKVEKEIIPFEVSLKTMTQILLNGILK